MNTIEWNQSFIVAAYSVAWLVLIGYLARLTRKAKATRTVFERMSSDNSGIVNR